MSDYKTDLDNGINLIYDGNFQDGIDLINKSLKIKADWNIPYFYRGVANQALENWDEAILDYTKALKYDNKMTDAYYNIAHILLSRKDIENPDINQAITNLDKALQLDSKFIDALFAMAAAQKKLGNYHDALKYINRLLEIEPDAIHAKALKKLILQKYIV